MRRQRPPVSVRAYPMTIYPEAIQAGAAVVQAFAAVATLWVTWRLTILTGEYVKRTAEQTGFQRSEIERELQVLATRLRGQMHSVGAWQPDEMLARSGVLWEPEDVTRLVALGRIATPTAEAELDQIALDMGFIRSAVAGARSMPDGYFMLPPELAAAWTTRGRRALKMLGRIERGALDSAESSK